MNIDVSLILLIWAGFTAYNIYAELQLCARLNERFDRSLLIVIGIYTGVGVVAAWRLA